MAKLGPLFLDIQGIALSEEDKTLIANPVIGGVILFARNYESLEQLKALTRSIRAIRKDILISVDHEGGRVQRFIDGFTRLPAMGDLGELANTDLESALKAAHACGVVIAQELQEAGIDFSYTPVLDINYGRCDVIGNRAFHQRAILVSQLAKEVMSGLKSQGMATIGKHFPGHGYVTGDSHTENPRDDRDFKTLMQQDLRPYIELGSELDAIMTAHVIYTKIDKALVTYSRFWLDTILKQQLRFTGLIISDDLSMHAATGSDPIDRVRRALESGCDIVLLCNDREAMLSVIKEADSLKPYMCKRIPSLAGKKLYSRDTTAHDAALATLSELNLIGTRAA